MDTCDCANGYVLKRMWVTESDVRYPHIYHSPDFFFDTASLTKSEARLTWQKAAVTHLTTTCTVMGPCEV